MKANLTHEANPFWRAIATHDKTHLTFVKRLPSLLLQGSLWLYGGGNDLDRTHDAGSKGSSTDQRMRHPGLLLLVMGAEPVGKMSPIKSHATTNPPGRRRAYISPRYAVRVQ